MTCELEYDDGGRDDEQRGGHKGQDNLFKENGEVKGSGETRAKEVILTSHDNPFDSCGCNGKI